MPGFPTTSMFPPSLTHTSDGTSDDNGAVVWTSPNTGPTWAVDPNDRGYYNIPRTLEYPPTRIRGLRMSDVKEEDKCGNDAEDFVSKLQRAAMSYPCNIRLAFESGDPHNGPTVSIDMPAAQLREFLAVLGAIDL